MIRLAFIGGTFEPARCGIAHYTTRLCAALRRQQVEVVVLTTHAAARAVDADYVLGVVERWGLADLFPLVRAIHALELDIVHLQYTAGRSGRFGYSDAILLLPLLLKLTGWRGQTVTTIHEQYERRDQEWQLWGMPRALGERLKDWGHRRGWWDREGGLLLTLSAAVMLSNAHHEQLLKARLPRLADRICRIPIGANIEVVPVDPQAARQALRRQQGWPADALVIVFFGYLNPHKGLETLLRAFGRVHAALPTARLLLIGGAECATQPGASAEHYWAQLHAGIAGLGLAEAVRATGYLPAARVSHLLSGADLGALPFDGGVTLKSGSLMALLAHGLPVVVTRHDPPDPDLHDLGRVRYVPPRDDAALAGALLALIGASEPGASEPGASDAAAPGVFGRHYSWSVIAQRHVEVYRAALEQRPVRHGERASGANPTVYSNVRKY